MALFFPDILQHNNQTRALADITEIRGNSYPLGNISETGSIPIDKRNIGQLVFASSSQQFYAYKGQTTSSVDWDTTSNWVVISGVDTTAFATTGSNTFIGNQTITGSVTITGSFNLPALSTSNQPNVVLVDTASGQFYYTASSAFGGGSGVTINNNVDNYILTATGTANTIQGEPNFQFNGTSVILTGSLLVTQSYISTIDYIDFTKIPLGSEPPHVEGRLHWYDDTKTLQIDTDKNNFTIEVGHQNVVRVYNDTGADIQLGKVVRISGSQGNQPTIVTASWTDDSTSAATLGFTATLIAGSGGNRHGYVITNGLIRNVNTLGYPVGTQLYLSSSGNFTSTPPRSIT